MKIGVFHAFKHWHSKAIADATQAGCGKFYKNQIFGCTLIRQKTFKKRTSRHGFSLTGIYSYNLSVVLEKLAKDHAAIFSSTESSMEFVDSISSGSMPKSAQKFAEKRQYYRELSKRGPTFQHRLDKCDGLPASRAYLPHVMAATLSADSGRLENAEHSIGGSRPTFLPIEPRLPLVWTIIIFSFLETILEHLGATLNNPLPEDAFPPYLAPYDAPNLVV